MRKDGKPVARVLVADGVEITDIKRSGGPPARKGDIVEILFSVALSEAELAHGIFLESTMDPARHFEARLDTDHLLAGLVLGIEGMEAGGSLRRIFLAPHVAYGERGLEALVPPNSPLVFDIILSTVSKVS